MIGRHIAEIQIHNDEMDISFCTIKQERVTFLICNTVTTQIPDFIQSDETMSEEEKEIAFKPFEIPTSTILVFR